MHFLYPGFLYALALTAIPVIIHLFNFRRHKTVYYSNIQFLKEVKEQNKAVRQLKDILTLIFRILAIAALVFAFAAPYIPPATEKADIKRSLVGIYIDNSFSTEAEGKEGKLIETAKIKAQSIIDAYPDDTPFLFLNNNFEAKHQHFVSKMQLQDFIFDTQVSGYTQKLSSIINRMQSLFSERNDNSVFDLYLISDFQKTISDIENFNDDSLVNTTLIPLRATLDNNILIDSVWFSTPYRAAGQKEELKVSITNKSAQDYLAVPLRLYLNDSLKVPATFDIKANESTERALEYVNTITGIVQGKVEIDDYPVTFDNNFYFSVSIKHNRNILIINEEKPNKYIASVVSNHDYFKVEQDNVTRLKISEVDGYDILIINSVKNISSGLNRRLVNFVSEGGTLVIFTGTQIMPDSYNELLQAMRIGQITGVDSIRTEIQSLAYESELYKNVFDPKQKDPQLPYVQNKISFSPNLQSVQETILADERNRSVLTKTLYGKGQVYFFSIAAQESAGDFVYHPLWAPTIYNMMLMERHAQPYFYTVGDVLNFTIDAADYSSERPVKLTKPGTDIEYITEHTGTRNRQSYSLPGIMTEAGNFHITQEDKLLKGVSLNYSREESDLRCYSPDTLKEELLNQNLNNYSVYTGDAKTLSRALADSRHGKDIRNFFIIAALLFLLGEIISLRYINKKFT